MHTCAPEEILVLHQNGNGHGYATVSYKVLRLVAKLLA